MLTDRQLSDKRKRRVRARIRRVSGGRPRLSVFRSNRHMYAQIIDDSRGITLVAASTLETRSGGESGSGAVKAAATRIGALIAERAKAAGVTKVVFDRGEYLYHGRVKALADAAREGGLSF